MHNNKMSVNLKGICNLNLQLRLFERAFFRILGTSPYPYL